MMPNACRGGEDLAGYRQRRAPLRPPWIAASPCPGADRRTAPGRQSRYSGGFDHLEEDCPSPKKRREMGGFFVTFGENGRFFPADVYKRRYGCYTD